jgi:trehalose synthase
MSSGRPREQVRSGSMGGMEEVRIRPLPLDRLAELLEPDRARHLHEGAAQARALLAGRVIWNVNATARGGGVAEMLQTLLAYVRGAGVDTRWLVLRGDPEFFAITKRLHNLLHGDEGDGGPVGDAERRHYEEVLRDNLSSVAEAVDPGDVVLLHDPQTAGLVEGLRQAGAHVVWRCHIGLDTANDVTRLGWSFLRPYVEQAENVIFSRAQYCPDWVDRDRLHVIPPSIDPFSPKNQDLTPAEVESVVRRAGLVSDGVAPGEVPFQGRAGLPATVRVHRDVLVGGDPPPEDARLVLQVSRWDRLKDMAGVLNGFVRYLHDAPDDVHLMLAGPDVSGVTDDPEGAEVLEECTRLWKGLPEEARRRVHLARVPMDDVDENAIIINALQRHAHVVVQKSLVEGFGLTVTEAMWKARPVIASAVGGIQDQIVDGRDGLLLADPRDLGELAGALHRVLDDEALAERLGAAARQRVQRDFLGDRHLIQYVTLFARLAG